jgi:twitching motility protein PilT
MELLKSNRVNPEEAYRCAIDKKQFEQYLPQQPGGAPAPAAH